MGIFDWLQRNQGEEKSKTLRPEVIESFGPNSPFIT